MNAILASIITCICAILTAERPRSICRGDVMSEDNGSPSNSWSAFLDLIKLGLRKIPGPTRVVLAALILFFATLFILRGGISSAVLFPAALGVLVVGVLVVAASGIISGRRTRRLGQFFAWFVVVIFVVVLGLFASSAFFGWPPNGAVLIARIFQATELVPRSNLDPVTIGAPAKAFDALPTPVVGPILPSDPIERVRELGKRPPVVIDGAVFSIGGPGDSRTISTQTLTLRSSSLITNGADLTIEVIDLIVENASIRSFEHPETPRQHQEGRDGGTVRLRIHGRIIGVLPVNLSGEAGDAGDEGGTGAKGGTGANGDNAASGAFDCKRGAGRGRPGATGGRGADGAPGLAGGAGGTLIVVTTRADTVRQQVQFIALGGRGGKGGAGGDGGPGGDGGSGGSPRGYCQGSGPRGASGEQGPSGSPGPDGSSGADGKIQFTETTQIGSES